MSEHTAALLLEHGFSYDHSQNYNDFVPFYARVGDAWTKVDFAGRAQDWMKPLRHGHWTWSSSAATGTSTTCRR